MAGPVGIIRSNHSAQGYYSAGHQHFSTPHSPQSALRRMALFLLSSSKTSPIQLVSRLTATRDVRGSDGRSFISICTRMGSLQWLKQSNMACAMWTSDVSGQSTSVARKRMVQVVTTSVACDKCSAGHVMCCIYEATEPALLIWLRLHATMSCMAKATSLCHVSTLLLVVWCCLKCAGTRNVRSICMVLRYCVHVMTFIFATCFTWPSLLLAQCINA